MIKRNILTHPDDNCYSEVATGYPNTDYAPVVSPYARYKNMTQAVSATGRPMVFQICEWGLDFPSLWAPELGHTWRITNDIIPAWRSIPRILNQAVPQTSFAGPGQWLDLDMLEVGNHVLTTPEEQTHFSLWAIIKSPLVIGTALYDAYTSISASSLAILKNTDVIGYNQDSLGVAATFRRRWTSDYEIWSGPLSGGRTVVAVINLSNETRNLTLALPDVGFQTAESVKDIWNNITAENVVTSYTGAVEAHGTLLLELAGTTTAGQYTITNAQVSGLVLPTSYSPIHFTSITIFTSINQLLTEAEITPHSRKYMATRLAQITHWLLLLHKQSPTQQMSSLITPSTKSRLAPSVSQLLYRLSHLTTTP